MTKTHHSKGSAHSRAARATAHANIALAKYWGKADAAENMPAVPSVSVALEALNTSTLVRFDNGLVGDSISIDGRAASPGDSLRVVQLLDRVRKLATFKTFAHVDSHSNFPAASGLASSASAFAALALAATRAAGLQLTMSELSDLARTSSASAARSVTGAWSKLRVALPGKHFLAAETIAPATHWAVAIVVAITSDEAKSVGSTQGMLHSEATSPYYPAWVELGQMLCTQAEHAIRQRDLAELGPVMERSSLAMHACAMASAPPLMYFEPATIGCLQKVKTLRADGIQAYATIDAGPHVKVLTHIGDAHAVARALQSVDGVLRVIVSGVGGQATASDVLETGT